MLTNRFWRSRRRAAAPRRIAAASAVSNVIEPLEQRALLSAAGDLDPSFGAGDGRATYQARANAEFEFVNAVDARNGRIVVGGTSDGKLTLAAFNDSGTLDSSFGGGDGIVVED